MTTSRQDLKLLAEELNQDVPEPVHSMLEKETKKEANNPPTCTGNGLGVMSYNILIPILYDKFQKNMC